MLRGFAVAAGALVLALVPNAWTPRPTVHAQSVRAIETGVWWIGQPRALPALPPPAQVPANGLWVSSTVAGTVAMSAVRFTVGANDRQPVLTIPIRMSTAPPAALPLSLGMPMLACPTTGNWKPPAKGTFGSLAAAPSYDCGKAQVLGAPSLDGKALVFELGSFRDRDEHDDFGGAGIRRDHAADPGGTGAAAGEPAEPVHPADVRRDVQTDLAGLRSRC